MPAFIKAHECGADVVELDVHLSRDGRCVVIHDDELERTTDGQGLVRNYSWEELKKLDAGSWFDRYNREQLQAMQDKTGKYANPAYKPSPIPTESFAGTPIPVLEEVLEWAKAVGMPVSIELKVPYPFYGGLDVYPDIVERVHDLVARYGNEADTQIHSFDHRLVLRSKELKPNIPTQISFYGAIMVNPLSLLDDARADGVAIGSVWITRELIDFYHQNQRSIFAWGPGEDPLNEEEELAQLVQMGVDYVSGGYPDILRQVVEKYL
jgi:glycerophosphoryl diester phosphodiesterase